MRGVGGRTAVVLDRHPLWLEAMAELLEGEGVEVVARTSDSDTALAMVEEHRPDVLVAGVDLTETGASGIECVRRAGTSYPGVKSVVVGESDDASVIDAAFEAGAAIYCVKTAEKDDLASAVRQAFRHSIFIATDRQARAVTPAPTPPETEDAVAELTRREVEILQLVAEGHSNSQLARMLWVTEQTVKFHLSNIYRKLEVANRTEASRWAQLHGLLPAVRPALTESAA
jgi:DNA-binding NarL/FixJ family response regulator